MNRRVSWVKAPVFIRSALNARNILGRLVAAESVNISQPIAAGLRHTTDSLEHIVRKS